jgi:vacuolar protein 8
LPFGRREAEATVQGLVFAGTGWLAERAVRTAMVHMKRVTPAELEAAGTVSEMVAKLRSGTQEVKEHMARIIQALTTQAPASTPELVQAGVIGPLVKLLKEGNEQGQGFAAAAIASIASDSRECQAKVVVAGGVEPLVKLLRMGSAGTQEQAASALASVSQDKTYQQLIVDAGALMPLVNLLRGGKGDTQVHAAHTLANLVANHKEYQNMVVAAGGLPLVLVLLESAKEKTQIHAARATAKLCENNREIQEQSAELGAIPPLLNLLNGRNIEAQVQAAAAVAELARENAGTQAKIAKAGGISPLLAMLTSRNVQAQSHAASALAQLARFNRENQDSIAEMGALSTLGALISEDSGLEAQAMSALAVAEIARENPANQTTVAELGAIVSIVVLIKHSNSMEVKAECAGAIWVLADHHADNRVSFAQQGAVASLVALLAQGSQRAQEHAANALASLSLDNVENLKQVTTLLVNLLGSGDLSAKSIAAATLWRLVGENPSVQKSIASAGSATDLVTLLKAGSKGARDYALWSLSLSINEMNQAIVLAEGGVTPLIRMLTDDAIKTREEAAAALALLAYQNAETQSAIARSGGVEPLVAMLDPGSSSPTAQEQAAAAIAELALLKDVAATIVRQGSIVPLVALVRAGREMGKRFAAAALARLARNQESTQAEIANAGAIAPLVGLLAGDKGETAQEEAAGALYELAANANNRNAITDSDGIGPLVSLLGSENSRTRQHAEGGLVRLSIENSNRVLIIKQLVSMLHDSGKEPAAAALANLASDSVGNRVSIVEAGGVRPLLTLLENTSNKARENSIMAITHLAHESEERQTAIAEAGGIPLVVNVLISASSNVKETSVGRLCSLAADAVARLCDSHEGNQAAITEAGAIPALVAMLGSPSPQMQATAAGAIGALVRDNAENQAAVARTGAIAPLCANVREGNPETKERSAWALWALATNNAANKATIAKLGGIEPLVGLLVGGTDDKSMESAGIALASLSAKNTDNRIAIAKRLVGLLGSRVAERTVRVLSAISEMTTDNVPNQNAIAKAGGISYLITWLSGGLDSHSFSAEAQKEAARAVLAMACSNPQTQVLIVKHNGIPPLIELIAKSKNETQEYAARALWHCAGNNESKVIIAESGGIPPLVSMLSVEDTHAQEISTVVLARLANSNETVSVAIAECGGIAPLVRLLKLGTPVAQLQAAAALVEVSAVPENRDKVAKVGGIGPLVMCMSSTVAGLPEVAARALSRLARDYEESGADGGGEPEEVPDEVIEQPGARRRAEIAALGGVTKLIEMLEPRSVPGMAKKIWSMVALVMGIGGGDPNGSQSIDAGSAFSEAATSEHSSIGVQEQAAATLCDISYGDRAMQDEMIREGAILHLLNIMRNGTQLGQEYAVRAIWHLCASIENQGVVVDGGALPELVMLSKTGSDKSQELSAAVISDLARGTILERDRKLKALGAIQDHHAEVTATTDAPAVEDEESLLDSEFLHDVIRALGVDRRRKLLDIFRDLDVNGDGSITMQEFIQRSVEKGIDESKTGDLGKLFEEIDVNSDRAIAYSELRKMLRAIRKIDLPAQLRPGGAGPVELEAKNATALRGDGSRTLPGQAREEVNSPVAAPADDSAPPSPPPIKGDRLSSIAAAGGIGPLVVMLSSGSLMGKERAAGALWHLSVAPANRMAIAKAGGIPPLVQLFDDGTLQASIYGSEALNRLAKNNPDNQTQIAKKLVSLLSYKNPGAQQRAAHILWELATSDPGAPVIIVNAGAISPLVMLVSCGKTECKKEAAGALSTLAFNNPSNQLAIATGCVALLGCGSAEAQEHVTLLLLSLASDADNRKAIAKAGAVARLVAQLRGEDKEMGEHCTKPQELAAAALSYLSSDSDDNVKAIRDAGGIECLAKMLSSDAPEGQAHAAAVLSDMTRVYRDEVVQQGCIEVLVGLLSGGINSDIKAEAAGALWSVSAGGPVTQNLVADAGAIPPLVQLLEDPAMRTRRKAAAALTSLAVSSTKNQNTIAHSGSLALLVKLLDEQYSGDVQLYAAGALAELARCNPKNQQAIAKLGCIPKLVKLLVSTSSVHVLEEAAGTLWCLAANHYNNQVAIAEADGIAPLVALLGRSGPRVQEMAVGALAALALNNEKNKVAIAVLLVGLLSPHDKEASSKAARAISRLARAHPTNQEAISSAGGIPVLVSLLDANPKRKVEAAVQKEFAAALWSMAYDNVTNQAAIAQAGGIPPLIGMLSSNPEVHGDAAGALHALAADPANRKLIASKGAIVPLVALLKAAKGAQEVAAGVLGELAKVPENRVAITDASGVPALVKVFETGSLEGVEQAASALLQLVVNNSVNQSSVARELVAMLNGSSSQHAQEHATTVIRNLVLHPENRASVASAGAIPQLAKQLRDGMESSQAMAASALSQIALESATLRVSVTQELVGLLGSTISAVRNRAAIALREMNAEAGSESRMSIAMAGGIARFVALLKEGSLEAQEYALWSLWQSIDAASKISIAESCGSKPIIQVLLQGKLHQVAQEHAAGVLAALTSAVPGVSDELRIKNSKDVVTSGGIKSLVSLLRSGNDGAKRHASLVLAQLSRGNEEMQVAVTSSGAISAFVEWLADSSLGPPEVAARALADIAQDNKDSQINVMEEGAIPCLIKMVSAENGKAGLAADRALAVEGQKHAASALAALAQNNHLNQVSIYEEGGIQPLVALLESENAIPHENATRALWHLSANMDNKLAISREGGMVLLVKLLVDGAESNQEWASAALESLTNECPDNQVAQAAVDAIQPLVNLLGSENEATQDHAVGALINISSPSKENRIAVVKPLVALLEVRNATAQMKAAQALVMLAARSSANRLAIAESGAIPPLVHLLGDGRNATTPQVRAAAVLADLARAGENKTAIVNAGGVQPLVKMLTCANVDAQVASSSALSHLAANTAAQQLMTAAGAITSLVAMLSGPSLDAARYAAGALWHLEVSADNKGAIVKAGGIPPLVILLRKGESPEAQEVAAMVLADLARSSGGCKAITIAGGVPSLVNVMFKGSCEAQKHAVCAIWSLTCESVEHAERNIKAVTSAGGLPTLVRMVAARDEALGYAVATLKNLSQDVQAQNVMQEEGVVDFLKPLIQGPESWIKTQAIAVLHNLGVDFTAHESGAPKAANEPPADAQGRSAQQNIKSSTARLSPQMKFHGQKANAGAGTRSEYLR